MSLFILLQCSLQAMCKIYANSSFVNTAHYYTKCTKTIC